MHEGHRERMRNKYLQGGIDALAPHEVLEMLLFYTQPRINTNETAHRLLETFPSFSSVLDADYESLLSIEGVGPRSAFFLRFLKDCINLYGRSKQTPLPTLPTATDAGNFLLRMVGNQTTEGFYVVCLDPERRVLAFKKLFEGATYSVHVEPRAVVTYALQHNACAVIVAHNHPNGPTRPSEDDILLTERLRQAFDPIGVYLIDHIIVSQDSFFSMAANATM